MDRRSFLAAGGLVGLGTAAGAGFDFARTTAPEPLSLTVSPARYSILDQPTEGMVSLSPDAPPPVLRLKQNRPFTANVTNAIPDYTAMHWHGIRVPNAMDGVPYLTQLPLGPDETFRYAFTPQDAGTFWYHPHCMTMEQMARGLTGVLVVEEEDDPGFDTDLAINLRDFRLGGDGQFIDLFTPRGAARGGTLGTVMTANWQTDPVYGQPSGGLVRLRLAATDITRIYRLYLTGAEGDVRAIDGHPLPAPVPLPTLEAPLVLSPGQRVDIALKMPGSEDQEIELMEAGRATPRRLAKLRTVGGDQSRDLRDLRPLPANPVSEPDLASTELAEFVFGWSPEGDATNNGLCGSFGYTFWSINRKPWPGDAVSGTGPLATMKLGKSYILRLRNESPNDHPIHLHGLVFKPIRSNKRQLPPHWTDTALLLRDETLDIALVADNPGDWAFHCHVIEHQKSGLSGYVRVE